MEEEFDMVNIVRDLRNFKLLLERHKLVDTSLKVLIENQDTNVIEIDSSSESHKSGSEQELENWSKRNLNVMRQVVEAQGASLTSPNPSNMPIGAD